MVRLSAQIACVPIGVVHEDLGIESSVFRSGLHSAAARAADLLPTTWNDLGLVHRRAKKEFVLSPEVTT
jgi:hypothetical protein